MKSVKQIIAGIVVLGTFATGVCAGATINAQLKPGIKVVLDGKQQQITDAYGNTTSPISYNDTTYLPIRSVASLCGKAVGWDNASQTIILTSGGTSSGDMPSTAYISVEKLVENVWL